MLAITVSVARQGLSLYLRPSRSDGTIEVRQFVGFSDMWSSMKNMFSFYVTFSLGCWSGYVRNITPGPRTSVDSRRRLHAVNLRRRFVAAVRSSFHG